MTKLVSTFATIAYCFLLVACATASAQPDIRELPGSDAVRVLRGDKGEPIDGCTLIDRIEVIDGQVAWDDSAYRGTMDRIELKLRNKAVLHDANVAYILDIERPLVIDSPGASGQRVIATANLFNCPSDSTQSQQ